MQEREQFLTYLLRRGCSKVRVQAVACHLLVAVKALRLNEGRAISAAEIDNAIARIWGKQLKKNSRFAGCDSAYCFRGDVLSFLRFHRMLKTTAPRLRVRDIQLAEFANFLTSQDLTDATVEGHRQHVRTFLRWLTAKHRRLVSLSPTQLNAFISEKRANGWALATLSSSSQAIKSFLRYAERRRWCKKGLAEAVKAPRCSRFSAPPQGREWFEVKELLKSVDGKDHATIRARAALLLIATYALRSGEMARLRISDFDWKKRTLTVHRLKKGSKQRYPLGNEVAEAVHKYLGVRPKCNSDRLFLTIKTPYRPVRRKSFYSLTSYRLEKIGIIAGRRGPHAIRHAIAMNLLRRGASLKQIGDFLGQRHPESPLFYAKFDVKLLRPVADFRFSELL